MRDEYDFKSGERGRYAGRRIVIVGAEAEGGEETARQMPPSFEAELEEEFRLAEEAARGRGQVEDGGDELDGWTVEAGTHRLPAGVAAKLAGRGVREDVLPACREENCAECDGFAIEEEATVVCTHFCHGAIQEGGEA